MKIKEKIEEILTKNNVELTIGSIIKTNYLTAKQLIDECGSGTTKYTEDSPGMKEIIDGITGTVIKIIDSEYKEAIIYMDSENPIFKKYILNEDKKLILVADSKNLCLIKKNKDKNKISIIKNIYDKLNKVNRTSSEYLAEIEIYTQKIEKLMLDIKSYRNSLTLNSKKLENNKNYKIDFSSTTIAKEEEEYNKLVSSGLIVSYSHMDDSGIIFTTDDLLYNGNGFKNYPIGAFKIMLKNDDIKIVNYKKHVDSILMHPCISTDFHLCMGEDVRESVMKSYEENNYKRMLIILIDFLKNPNYGTPYNPIDKCVGAQPVTIRPRDEENYFNKSYWNKNEIWTEQNNLDYLRDNKEFNIKYK